MRKSTGEKVVYPKAMNDVEKACHDPIWSGMNNHVIENHKFTGVARSVICEKNGDFSNFRVLTMEIEDGKVIRTKVSDSYMYFDVLDRLLTWDDRSLLNLRMQWKEGLCFQK